MLIQFFSKKKKKRKKKRREGKSRRFFYETLTKKRRNNPYIKKKLSLVKIINITLIFDIFIFALIYLLFKLFGCEMKIKEI